MKSASPYPVSALLHAARLGALGLEVIAGHDGVARREIVNPRIQKPGLALAGYLPYLKPGRVQILGASEFDYLATLPPEAGTARLVEVIELEPPAIIAAKGNRPSPAALAACDRHAVPFLATSSATSEVIESVSALLEDELAPCVQLHGVLVDVFSLGTLIVGDAGIGKSECALELIYRGHRLVADDIVVIRKAHNQGLRGYSHELLQNYLELRGVGIIDVRKHFGMTATSTSVNVSLVIQLLTLNKVAKEMEQQWRETMLERPRAWATTETILGVEVPKYAMAVAPGRDVALMVETAVRKCLLASRGVQDEKQFLDVINRIAAGDKGSRVEDADHEW